MLKADISNVRHPELIHAIQLQRRSQIGIHRKGMVRVGGYMKPFLAQAQQIILAHQAQNPFVIDHKAASRQFFGDGAIAITGHLQSNALDGITQQATGSRLQLLQVARFRPEFRPEFRPW